MNHIYIAPSGVVVLSCKPEPRYQGLIEHVLWSYRSWGTKIVRATLDCLPGLD